MPLNSLQTKINKARFQKVAFNARSTGLYPSNKDANVVLWGLMNCVSRVMQAKHDGDLNASAEELERMASAYAESFRKAQ